MSPHHLIVYIFSIAEVEIMGSGLFKCPRATFKQHHRPRSPGIRSTTKETCSVPLVYRHRGDFGRDLSWH
jgi:hypothetical protein